MRHPNENTIKNLRFRWKEELSKYSDKVVAALYEDFSMSEDYGNNDEKFPLWFDLLSEYKKDAEKNT
jgi:hypothetical protein